MAAIEELWQGDEVVVRLAHLLSVDGYHIVVHPIVNHLVALTGHSLCYLALVMGEDKVHAATVDIEVVAQILASHSRTFAVPAGESVAPLALPTHDVLGLSCFPQGKVGLVLLLAYTGQLTACILDILQIAPRENSVFVVLIVFLYVEIYAAVTLVGITVLQNLVHQFLLLHNMACGMRLDAGRQTVQGCHSIVETVGIVLSHFHGFQLLQTGFLGNLILALVGIMLQVAHIRNVTYVTHLVAYVL